MPCSEWLSGRKSSGYLRRDRRVRVRLLRLRRGKVALPLGRGRRVSRVVSGRGLNRGAQRWPAKLRRNRRSIWSESVSTKDRELDRQRKMGCCRAAVSSIERVDRCLAKSTARGHTLVDDLAFRGCDAAMERRLSGEGSETRGWAKVWTWGKRVLEGGQLARWLVLSACPSLVGGVTAVTQRGSSQTIRGVNCYGRKRRPRGEQMASASPTRRRGNGREL